MNDTKKILDKYKDEMIRSLVQLISIPSVSSDEKERNRALEYVLEKGREYGLNVRTSSTKKVGIVEYGSGNETIGTAVHVDVVPAGDTALWRTDPFQGVVEGNRIVGRGAYDNKGAVIAVLYGLIAAKESGVIPKKKVQIIIGTQEEVEWSDMEEFDREMPYPDYGFTPDGIFPIQNTEKGYADLEIVFKDPEAADGNEKNGKLKSIWAGFSRNTIPEIAKAELEGEYDYFLRILDANPELEHIILGIEDTGRTTVTAKGKSAHSSEPEKGDNAIWRLADYLGKLDLKVTAESRAVRFIKDALSNDYYGQKLGFNEDEFYNGVFVHRTTVSPTYLRKDGGKIYLSINMRTRYGTEKGFIEELFEQIRDKYDIDHFKIIDYDVPILVMPDKGFIKVMAKAYESVTGKKNYFTLDKGTTYAKAFPNMVIWGPLHENGEMCAHQENEFMEIDKMIEAAKVYAEFYVKALSTDVTLK